MLDIHPSDRTTSRVAALEGDHTVITTEAVNLRKGDIVLLDQSVRQLDSFSHSMGDYESWYVTDPLTLQHVGTWIFYTDGRTYLVIRKDVLT